MAKKCQLCGVKFPFLGGGYKIADAEICVLCSNLSANCQLQSLEDMERFKWENDNRKAKFSRTNVLKSFGSSHIFIDNVNKFFCIGSGKDKAISPYTIVYSFHDVIGYYNRNGSTMIAETHGNSTHVLTRNEQDEKNFGQIHTLRIRIHTYSGKSEIIVVNPPLGIEQFLDSCISESQAIRVNETQTANTNSTSAADEILKYKMLYDQGVITQEEFEAKKRQLLNL